MNQRDQWLCLWCGPLFIVLLLFGFWTCAGFIPPTSPMITAAEVVAFYQNNLQMIRLGLAISLLSSGLLVPWAAVIATQMKRIQGIGATLAYTQLSAGGAGALVFINPYLIWALAAFRPERAPETTFLLHDLGWISFIMAVPLAIIQVLAFGAAVLLDKGARPIFPRWAGYFSIWVALLFVPAGVTLFFKQGAFAWNGLFPFWIPLFAFTSWFAAVFILMFKAIKRQAREEN